MESHTVLSLRNSSHRILGQDTSDCSPSPFFSHEPENPATSNACCSSVHRVRGSRRRGRSQFLVEVSDEDDAVRPQTSFFFHGRLVASPPSTELVLRPRLPIPNSYKVNGMANHHCPGHAVPGLLPKLLPPPHDAFLRAQPPSPPLDTPELVQRRLPTSHDASSPLLTPAERAESLSEGCDTEMLDAEGRGSSRPSTSRLCNGQPEDRGPPLWPLATHGTVEGSSPSISLASTSTFQHPELLTPVTPTMSWLPSPHSSYPDDDPMEFIDDIAYPETDSDWNMDGSLLYGDPERSSSRHRSRSLELPEVNGFRPPSPGSSYSHPIRAYSSPAQLEDGQRDVGIGPLWNLDLEETSTPHSPRPRAAALPTDFHSSGHLFDDGSPFDTDSAAASSSAPRRDSLSLPDLFTGDMLISPSSPRAFTTRLPELDMDELEAPSSPHSPYRELLPMEEDDSLYPTTVAPSLLGPPSHEGLGLFLQESSIDPPLARSPSPDEDDLAFLDIQLDSASTSLELDEFLQLRTLRRRVLDAERDARMAETELAERVNLASEALLPGRLFTDIEEKRMRKYELHVAMEMRSDARKARKHMKQRNREIGALLDLKMERNVLQGKTAMRSVPQLVANMVLKRRDIYRPLANRRPASVAFEHRPSPLQASYSVDDLIGEH